MNVWSSHAASSGNLFLTCLAICALENGVLKEFCEVDANECVCCALDVLLFENTVLL